MPPANLPIQRGTMIAIVATLILLTVLVDVFAFENGAWATISQATLRLNLRFWVLTYLLAAFAGGLVEHLAVPHDPAKPPPKFWRQALLWAVAFVVGAAVAWRWLWQLPGRD